MKLQFSEQTKWGLLVFALAFLVRLANLIFLSHNDPSFFFPQVDSAWHHQWAVEIATKDFWGKEVFFRGPLYPYTLALIYMIFGVNVFAAKIIQAVGSSLSCVLIYQIARKVFEERVARIASLLLVFYGTIIYYDSELLIEWEAILFALVMMNLMLGKKDSQHFRDWFLIGIFGGLSAIARPNVLLVFPLYAVWLILRKFDFQSLWRRLAPPIGLTLGVITCIAPVTVRNYFVAKDPVLISSQGGVNFYLANNPDAEGLTMRMPEIRLDLSIPWNEFVDTTNAYAESAVGRKMKPSELSDFWNRKTIDYISSHPLNFMILTAKRIIYFFSSFENPDQTDIYEFAKYSPVLGALIFDHGIKIPFGFIAPLSLLGLILSFRLRRQLIVLYIFMIGYIPTVVFFLVTARHRLAICMILTIFAAFAISEIIVKLRTRNWKTSAMLLGTLALLILACNQTPFELGQKNELQFYYQRGIALEKQGKINEAITAYREAVKTAPSPEAFNNLGYALTKTGNKSDAYQAYHQALRYKPGFADALNNLGLLFLRDSKFDSAEGYFLNALYFAPKKPQVYLNLGDLYKSVGRAAAAETSYVRGITVSPEYEPTYSAIANLCLQGNRIDDAKRYLERILKIKPDYITGNVNYANLLLQQRQFDDAKRYYLKAIEINPRLVEAHFNLAVLYLQMNQPDSGRIRLEEVLRIDPNYVPARRALESLR